MAADTLQDKFNVPTRQEIISFVSAASAGNDAAVMKFLEKYGSAYIEEKDDGGFTALMDATACGRRSTVELLLEKGADINQKNNDGWTPLMRAVWNERVPVAELLLEKGAAIDVAAKNGYTIQDVLHSENCNPKMAELLEKWSAKRKQQYEEDTDFSRGLKHPIPRPRPFNLEKKP